MPFKGLFSSFCSICFLILFYIVHALLFSFTYIYCIRKFGGAFMFALLSTAGFIAFLKSAVFIVGYIQGGNLFP